MSKLLWLPRQVEGWLRNVLKTVSSIRFRDIFPPAVLSTLAFIRDQIPIGLGFTKSRVQHVMGVISTSITLVVASFGILTFVGIGFLIVFGSLAALRFWPAVERRWPLSESDWPLWEVK